MPIIDLHQARTLSGEDSFQAYACLDTTGTLEIFNILFPRLTAEQQKMYEWSLAQQSPALTMGLRGIRVDLPALDRAKKQVALDLAGAVKNVQNDPLVKQFWDGTKKETGRCSANTKKKVTKKAARELGLPEGVTEVEVAPKNHKWPKGVPEAEQKCELCGTPRLTPAPFEPSSGPQTLRLLYTLLRADKRFNRDGGLTADDEALERIGETQMSVGPDGRKKKLPGLKRLTDALREHRDLAKQAGFLNARLSDAGRYHANYNVAAPWTARWSSSKDPFGVGGNLQNVAERNRSIFIPDPGYEIFYADLKTAESLIVAYTAGDEAYIEAHKGDVHTWVTRELWPGLPWTGDIKKDKKIASSHNPPWDPLPGHDYRFQSKRVQHGSNYGLSPAGLAMIARIPRKAAAEAQERYFTSFPRIKAWHNLVQSRVSAQLPLYNALRRSIRLFGRPWDPHTFKQGLAFGPQSSVGDILNCALWRVWNECDPHLIQCLAQVHDAVLGQWPVKKREEAIEALKRLMAIPVAVEDIDGVRRACTIQVEVAAGANWGKAGPDNPKGLVEIA